MVKQNEARYTERATTIEKLDLKPVTGQGGLATTTRPSEAPKKTLTPAEQVMKARTAQQFAALNAKKNE